MKRTLSLLSIFLFISFPLAQTTFSSAQIINSSVTGARDVYSGDLDGDGDTDVLSASAGDGTFDWYENDGTGNFGEKQTIHTGTYDHPFSVLTIDMDNDGDLDVVSSANGNVSWHENNGDATSFNSYDISVASGNTYAVHAADIDDDGDVDVFAPSYGHNKVYWYENDGSENFTRHIIATTINGAFYVFTTDLDSDGDQDVLACGLGNQVAWLENDGNENFTTHTITTNITAATSVHSSDVDGDGDMDVLSSSRGDDRIAWYENDGNQNFTTHIITSSADVAYSVLSLDIDNDGDIDVISASEGDNKVAWYENDGNENFTTHVITTSANLPGAVHADDIDGDGDMDVLSASRGDDTIAWYEQEGSPNNAFQPQTTAELQTAVNLWVSDNTTALATYGEINTWDVSLITNMSNLFYEKSNFNDYINNWDVSNVTNMFRMFRRANNFNQDLNNWDVSNVTNMQEMFTEAYNFNGNISTWDVTSVSTMRNMFWQSSSFNSDITNWDVSNVTNMFGLFVSATVFNQDISSWDVSNITSTDQMFANTSFNQDISEWDLASNTSMSFMFHGSPFNQDISSWDVSNVTSMAHCFQLAEDFNQDLSTWDVSSVTLMHYMFQDAASLNQDLSTWDVSNVTNMTNMFGGTNALSDANKCDIHESFSSNDAWPYDWSGSCEEEDEVVDIDGNIYGTVEIGDQVWMDRNLIVTHFNNGEEIGSSNTAYWPVPPTDCHGNDAVEPTDQYGHLYNWYAATDDRDICPENWHVPSDEEWMELELYLGMDPDELNTFEAYRGTVQGSMLAGEENYWEDGALLNNDEFGSSGFGAVPAGYYETSGPGCFYGMNNTAFIWTSTEYNGNGIFRQIDKSNTGINRRTYINTIGKCIRCIEDEDEDELTPITQDNIQEAVDAWCLNPDSTEAIYGHISYWDVSNITNMSELFRDKTTFNDDINSWDVSNVTNMDALFFNASLFNQNLLSWDISNVNNASAMFQNATNFNQDISSWDVSSVTYLGRMFGNAISFDQDLSNWDVSNVEYMEFMFIGCENFNSNITDWDVTSAIDMTGIFENATSFNQDISNWDISNLLGMSSMFENAQSFDQDLSNWDVSHAEHMNNMFNNTALSEQNKCAIHNSFSSNENWPYNWSEFCPGEPQITSISDVPEDQGGRVYVEFSSSMFDHPEATNQSYTVLRMDALEDSSAWVVVASGDAFGDPSYTYEVLTLMDSTADDDGMTEFKVVAAMNEGNFHSAPAMGYSTDDIAPGVPQGLMAVLVDEGIHLTWEMSADEDFQYYMLEKSSDEAFTEPEVFEMIDIAYLDLNYALNENNYYRIAAVDHAGNMSDYSDVVDFTVLDTDLDFIPKVFALHQNYPNPFNPTTQIKYDLSEDAMVSITIYDLMGRSIRSLVNTTQSVGYRSIQWDATDNLGEPVSAGMYIYMIQAGEFRQTKKMVLLK